MDEQDRRIQLLVEEQELRAREESRLRKKLQREQDERAREQSKKEGKRPVDFSPPRTELRKSRTEERNSYRRKLFRTPSPPRRSGTSKRPRSEERRRSNSRDRLEDSGKGKYLDRDDLRYVISREVRGQMGNSEPRTPLEMARKALGKTSASPLSKEIEREAPPRRYTAISFNRYDGKTDPAQHVRHYEHMMILYRGNDSFMCKMFPGTLEGPAVSWFNRLEPRSIRSWRQLAEQFTARFISNSRPSRTISDLMHLKMERNETIKEFSRRFFDEANELDDVPHNMIAEAFKWGLPTESDLYKKLAKRPIHTLSELMHKVGEYSKLEQELAERNKRTPMKSAPPAREWERRPRPSDNLRRSGSGNDTRVSAKLAINTVFTEPMTKILKDIEKEEFFRWPAKQRSDPSKRDRNLRCHYHKDFGHTTLSCRSLKAHLDELAKAGHLQKYLKEGEPQEALKIQHEPLAVINVIHGSASDDRYSAKGIEDQLQAVNQIQQVFSVKTQEVGIKRDYMGDPRRHQITFSEDDLSGVIVPHWDPLVVSLQIGGKHLVKRVIVDGGAEADIMYAPLFNKLKLSKEDLLPIKCQLVGFSGQWTMALGRVTLPVKTQRVTVKVDFMVVDAPSPYNAILGRGWLHAMKAVPSTYHQVIKFPTPWGTKELKGDQKMARICSIAGATGKEPETIGQKVENQETTKDNPESSKSREQ